MEENNQILTATDYVAALKAEQEATDPRVLKAYDLQEQMQRTKKHYKELEDEFHSLLEQVGPYKNDYYTVSNLKRAPRKIEMSLIREHFPHLVDKAQPSEKYILQALIEEFGKDTLLRMAYDHNPQAYDDARTMSIADFDKETGDSSKKFLYAGKAYQERWIEDKNEPMTVTYIGKTLISDYKHTHPKQLQTADGWKTDE